MVLSKVMPDVVILQVQHRVAPAKQAGAMASVGRKRAKERKKSAQEVRRKTDLDARPPFQHDFPRLFVQK